MFYPDHFSYLPAVDHYQGYPARLAHWPGCCPLLCGGQTVARQPAQDGLTVQAVGDGGQHVSVPHPVDVQRGAPGQVALRALGDLAQQWQPELFIPEHGGWGLTGWDISLVSSTCIWLGRWWICRRGISHHQLPSRSPVPANQSRNALMEQQESKQGRAGQVSLMVFYHRKWRGKYQN